MFVLIHARQKTKPYIRSVRVDCTGIDISYCKEEAGALRFASRAAAIHVARALSMYGDFYPKGV